MKQSASHAKFINVMPTVHNYSDDLESLNRQLSKTTLTCKINGTDVAGSLISFMEITQGKFSDLQNKLIDNLVRENLKKTVQDISSKAQVAIDILKRNLFERTADVGFLAVDDDIRIFLSKIEHDRGDLEFIVTRLSEYVKKYSVYEEIIILDPDGNVKAHLDASNNISGSTDPLIAETLSTEKEYIETFRHSDLQAKKKRSLIYSCKITRSNDAPSSPLGVLCLCFRFESEAEGIFRQLSQGDSSSVLLLLDENGEVIASSDNRRVSVSSRLRTDADLEYQLITVNREQYISKTARTKGYQGYFGLTWFGCAMAPLKSAFSARADSKDKPEIDPSIFKKSSMFSSELSSVRHASLEVTDDLKNVVLNGEIIASRQGARALNPILDNFRKIGENISRIFTSSIQDLHTTVISGLLNDVKFLASLAIDIMDRNLYERSDDCRWWALTSEFRRALSSGINEDVHRIGDILNYINKLYTVYINLFVYDRNGVIIAVSNPKEQRFVGRKLSEEYISRSLSNLDSQRYFVSPFEPTDLYDGKPTYIYSGSITSLGDARRTVGGIGIVFDSGPQFHSMLSDALPRDGGGRVLEGSFGIFTERNGKVVSSTSSDFAALSNIELPERFLRMPNGQGISEIISFRGRQYAVGSMTSSGYREYKNNGDYVNDIVALIFIGL